MYWITPDGSYYEGQFVAEGSIEVPQRPSEFHEYVNGEWVYSAVLKRAWVNFNGTGTTPKTTSAVRVWCKQGGSLVDADFVDVAVFR